MVAHEEPDVRAPSRGMTDDDQRRAFAQAFIAQARSDWLVYRVLTESAEVPLCHRLHYLQMACEKLAKAYRLRDTPRFIRSSDDRRSRLRWDVRCVLRST